MVDNMRKDFLKVLNSEILIYDGAMGTMLMDSGVDFDCPERLVLTHPELLSSIHKKYVDVGAQILETNTFGANPLKLSEYGLEGKCDEINKMAVSIARDGGGEDIYVAGSIGPLPEQLAPLGALNFDRAKEIFMVQIASLANAGADLILFETFSDILELKAAVIAAKEICDLPIQAQMTYEKDGRTLTGTSPASAVCVLEGLDVDVIGVNCGLGPQSMIPILESIVKETEKPIAVLPNAGIPKVRDGNVYFDETPEAFRSFAEKCVEIGVSLLGGCCGTGPEHIKAVSTVVRGKSFKRRELAPVFRVSSRTSVQKIGPFNSVKVIGERINPTARKKLQEELSEGKTSMIREDAVLQVKMEQIFLI
ncbi:MAG: homocysteine S-methyltransferase family protein [Candidatus Theseobacter exili]|nr:homocysteine S-methyltransferase family protein [Candidatus Theseobacter exili]